MYKKPKVNTYFLRVTCIFHATLMVYNFILYNILNYFITFKYKKLIYMNFLFFTFCIIYCSNQGGILEKLV